MEQGIIRPSQYEQYEALSTSQMNQILVAFSAIQGVRTFSVSAAGSQVTRGEAALALAPLSQAVAVHSSKDAISLAPVELSAGTLIGYQMDGVYHFKGVPYATAQRFQAPDPVTEYSSNGFGPEGVRMALAYGEVSPKSRTLNGTGAVNVVEFITPSNGVSDMVANETCQYLNVWTDDLTVSKPVIVFFHGGGLESGASNELSIYTDEYFAAAEDAVFVTVTHRLNYLGFLDLSAYGDEYEFSGDAGMLDCVAALQWVHDNIAKFGGDPANVTIAGQSGGGGKVAALSCMPAAEDLFDKVVYMSGVNMFINQDGEDGSLAQTQKLADYLKLSGQAFVDRVTTMSYEELYAACNEAEVSYNATVGCSAFPPPCLTKTASSTSWPPNAPG